MNLQDNDTKRFFIKTLGCKVNQYESQAIREILVRSGFRECLSADIADIFIINTCTVTAHADKASRRLIALAHKTNPASRLVITGCYVEQDSDAIAFLPGIAHIVKNDDKWRIAEILDPALAKQPRSEGSILKISDFKDHSKAFVKIQDGCENRCAYCKVPLVRNTLKSKPLMNILEEISDLVAKGFNEIVLTGICLGAWGRDMAPNAGLIDVLRELDRVRGDFRVRISSIEPRYVTDELIGFIAANKNICRHFHIPLQSGSDAVLKRMNRPYTSGEYTALVNRVKDRIKDVGISTDVMVGFPGETEEDFKNTVSVIKEIMPVRTHIFTYSKRKGTPAALMVSELNDKVLFRRYTELKSVAYSTSYLFRNRFMDKTLNVLVETRRDKITGMLKGYSDNYIKVLFKGDDTMMKDIVPVKIGYLNLMCTLGTYEK